MHACLKFRETSVSPLQLCPCAPDPKHYHDGCTIVHLKVSSVDVESKHSFSCAYFVMIGWLFKWNSAGKGFVDPWDSELLPYCLGIPIAFPVGDDSQNVKLLPTFLVLFSEPWFLLTSNVLWIGDVVQVKSQPHCLVLNDRREKILVTISDIKSSQKLSTDYLLC